MGAPKSVEQGASYSEGYIRYLHSSKGLKTLNQPYFNIESSNPKPFSTILISAAKVRKNIDICNFLYVFFLYLEEEPR